jgi:type II secretory pathway pseudopilin PulG
MPGIDMKARRERGLTLIEMLVSVGIGMLIVAAVSLFTTRALGAYRDQFRQVLAVQSARAHLGRINAELQNAVDSGSNTWLIKGTANELEVYTNIDTDPDLEILHYTLNGTTLTRGVIQPQNGTYPPGSEVSTVVDTFVRNIAQNQPLFTYYSQSAPDTPLDPATMSASDVYKINMHEIVDVDTQKLPAATDVVTSSVPRLGKKAATAADNTNNRYWPLAINLPVNASTNLALLTWTDPDSGTQTSKTSTVQALNAQTLAVYSKNYAVQVNYQATTIGSYSPGWYAYVGPILMGTAGSQKYYKTDQVPIDQVCQGADLTTMTANCPPRTLTLGRWEVSYRPILTYTDPATSIQDYVNLLTATYAGGPSPSSAPAVCPVPASGLSFYWKLDEGTGTTAANSVTSSYGGAATLQNGAAWSATTVAPVAFSSNPAALQLDGVNDNAVLAGTGGYSSTQSFAVWINPGSTSTGQYMLGFGKRFGFNASVYIPNTGASGDLGYYTYDGTTSTSQTLPGVIPANQWTHVAFVFDDVAHIHKIYVNGVLKKTITNANPRGLGLLKADTIGSDINGANTAYGFFSGYVDDVRVYQRTLSSSEVAQLAVRSGQNCVSASSPTPTPTSSPTPTPLPSTEPLLQGLTAYWKLDEGSGTAIYNAAGSGHQGLLNNGLGTTGWSLNAAPTLFSNSRSLLFDGVNDYAQVAPGTTGFDSSTLTVSAWVWPSSNAFAERDILSTMGNYNKDPIGGFTMSLLTQANNPSAPNAGLYMYMATGSNISAGAGIGNVVPYNTWSHVAVTFNDSGSLTTVTFYVNGVNKGAQYLSKKVQSKNPGYIGGYPNGTHLFGGNIDDVRIYNRVLSDSEIGQLSSGN